MSDKDGKKLSLADRIRQKQQATQAQQDTSDKGSELMSKFSSVQKDDGGKDDEPQKTEQMSIADRVRAKQAEIEAEADDTKTEQSDDMRSALAAAKQKEAPSPADDVKQLMRQRAEEQAALLSKRIEAKKADIEDEDEDDEPLSEDEALELQATVDDLRERYATLISKVKLTNIVSETEALGNFIEEMPEGIAQLRSRGYFYHAYLENKTEVLAERWDEINDKIEAWLEEEATELADELAEAENYVEKLDGDLSSKHKTIAKKLSNVLDILEAKVEASEGKIEALYEDVDREVQKTKMTLTRIGKYLQWMGEASFELDNGEGVYMVAEAEWRDGSEKPDGFLYLTNKRLVFEQNEKVGKRLGMFGGKKVREVLWEAPLDALQKSGSENKGMLGGIDLVHLNFDSGSRYAEITIEVKGGVAASNWAKQIKRAANGSIQADSTVEPDPELIERLREAPTDCNTCGATLPQIDAGDTEVACAYCGTVVRI